jgi:hypothetical protein
MNDFTICPYCAKSAILVSGKEIYPHRHDLFNKKFWLCRPCFAYVGTHSNSKRHHPLGRLANKELRYLKHKVHELFDPYWKSGKFSRSFMYERMAKFLNIHIKDCHVGHFDEEKCKLVINKLSEKK